MANGSTALIASTWWAFSAAAIFGNEMIAYFTVEGFTSSAVRTELIVNVWMLLGMLTAMVLCAKSAGRWMREDGSASTSIEPGVQVAPSANDLERGTGRGLGRLPDEGDVVAAAEDIDRA